jgi:glycosyltransferase involved in cell wall biosynthesis
VISILLPVFNAPNTIARAVDSLLAQTETDWELLILDDGSTDETPEILQALARRDPRIRVVTLPHRGITSTLNTGLPEARGELIARMDADDISLPDRLGRQREFLEAHPGIGLVSCRVLFGGDSTLNAGYGRYVDWINGLLTPEEIARHRFVESPLAHPSVMFRRELPEQFGGYSAGPFPEDYELWLRWLERGVRMAKVPEPLLVWDDPPSRLSRLDSRYSTDAFFRMKTSYLGRWLAEHNPHHPRVIVWGAGRLTRRRAGLLCSQDVKIEAYADIDPAKIGRSHSGAVVMRPEQLPPPGETFILSYVSVVEARAEIARWLDSHGYQIERDYLLVA